VATFNVVAEGSSAEHKIAGGCREQGIGPIRPTT
jgi:hypothetical protein